RLLARGAYLLTTIAAPTELTLGISEFAAPATTSTLAIRRQFRWPKLAAKLTQHERRQHKDGPGWSPATYESGKTRQNASVLAVSVSVADCDHYTDADYGQLRQRLDGLGLEYVLYSTYQSTPEDLRFRVVIPFAVPIPRD